MEPLNETCLIIPNAISPNDDNINDVWNIGMIYLYPQIEIKIFNRWGELLWKSEKGYPKPWDGRSNGTPLPIDSYHYIIDLHNGTKPIVGNITIVDRKLIFLTLVRRLIYILLLLIPGNIVFAQQLPLYSQYLYNKFLINPAVAGSDGYTSLNLTAREQWVGYYGAPQTFSFSGQGRVLKRSYIIKQTQNQKANLSA